MGKKKEQGSSAENILSIILSKELLVSIIISAIFPAILTKMDILVNAGQAVILGVLLLISGFLCKIFVQISLSNYCISNINDELEYLKNRESINSNFTGTMVIIQEQLKKITRKYGGNKNDIFIYFTNRMLDDFIEFEKRILQFDQLIINDNFLEHIEIIKKVFTGQDTDIFYAVSHIDYVGAFNTCLEQLFLRAIHDSLEKEKLKKTKRLFVFSSDVQLNDPIFRIVFSFHVNMKNYECALISRKEFDLIVSGFKVKDFSLDFGLYGNHFVWETAGDIVKAQSGCITRNEKRINLYLEIFNKLWNGARMRQYNIDFDESIKTIDTFFDRLSVVSCNQ